MRKFLFGLCVLAGCSGQRVAAVSTGSSGLTYYKDVKPLLDDKCMSCHSDGGIAPFTFGGYADVLSHLPEIHTAVQNRVMPPWLAGPGCTDYQQDRSLTDDQIATVIGWIDGGADEGDPNDYVALRSQETGISRVDLTLQMAAAYTPQQSPDEYRCFILDVPMSSDTFVTGFRANPGNPAIVHHVIAFLATPSTVAQYQQLDAADPAPGYLCFGGPGGSQTSGGSWIGAWAPGGVGYDMPPGTGIRIPAGSKVILQVHYNTAGALPAPDLTSLDLKLDPTVQKEAIQMPWTNPDWILNHSMLIPAGASDVKYTFDVAPLPWLSLASNGLFVDNQPVTAYTTFLHMHTHGSHGNVSIVRADGSNDCLLDVPRWDFHWQMGYAFSQPRVINPGDVFHLECHFDNAGSSISRNWGEGTDDEMCLTGFYVTQ
jgi:hypothetical protein